MARDPAEAVLILRLGCVAALVPLLMRLPLPWVSRLLSAGRPRAALRRRPIDAGRLLRCFDAAMVVARPVVRPGCLTRAVTLYWFLSRSGLPVELRFGIATDGEAVGHAWLALDDTPFLEATDPTARFTVTYRVGAAAA